MNDKTVPIALALGSNLGDRIAALRDAVAGLAPEVIVEKVSPVYETLAAYVADQPAYYNATLVARTSLSPQALLFKVKHLEHEIGRLPTFRYGPRLIDIDILFYGDEIFRTDELNIPHPRIAERAFVLRPLADIAPEWLHPETGRSVADMLAALPPEDMPCRGKLL